MAVTIGNAIYAADYNSLQTRISNVLGNGSTDFGYGQAVSSTAVLTSTDTITAAQMDLLRSDMNKAYLHQTGLNVPIRNISVGDVIGADVSGDTITYDTLGNYVVTDGGTNPSTNPADTTGGFNDYFDAMTDIENNRFLIDPGHDDISDLLTDSRTTAWNTSINNSFTVSFTTADARRHFFNSGGQIRIYASLAAGGGSKDGDWRAMMSNVGTICFGYNYTSITEPSAAGVTLASNIGNYGLTATYQEIFKKTGNATVYAENYWKIEVKENNDTDIQFRVTFDDVDTGDRPDPSDPPPYGALVDETVTQELTLYMGTRRAYSTTSFTVPNPAFATVDTLE